MPRIISGSARGTKLSAPAGSSTRPTGDRVKEALFSIITPHLPAKGFLDIFSGTGQIGLEAASRGSAPVVLIEKAPASLAVIKANLTKTHLEDKVQVMAADAANALKMLLTRGQRFTVIFLDPPYANAIDDFTRLAPLLLSLLLPDGLVILEHQSKDSPPVFVTNLQLSRSCQYGTAMLSFYKVDNSAD